MRTRLLIAITAIGIAACASTSTSSTSSSPPTTTAPTDTTPRPALELDAVARNKPESCGDYWLAGSTGRVTTDRGEVLVGATVAYCAYGAETALCLPWVKTETGGWYSILIGEEHRCMQNVSVRVIPPDGRRLSEAYCAPSLAATSNADSPGVLDLTTDLRVYTLDAPTSLPPRGDSDKPRTVVFPNGLELTFAPDDLAEGDQYEKLSAGLVTDPEPCFLEPGTTMDALYAFGPTMNVSVFAEKPNVRFKLPNPKGLPEGTVVEIFALGGSGSQLDADRPLPEGSFESVGLGHVEDGRIVPDSGTLPVLSVVGYRRR